MSQHIATSLVIAFLLSGASVYAQDAHKTSSRGPQVRAEAVSKQSLRGARVTCQNGSAAGFGCQMADLLALVDVDGLAAGLDGVSSEANDIWGWFDPETGKEYVLVGLNGGTSFVDISDPENPVTVGFLKTHTPAMFWRDIKVYKDHAFIVADAAGEHGMQIFDLTQLRSVVSPPVLFAETAHYDNINSAHNIVINEESGFAYIVGGSSGGETCGGGLHMVNIQDPVNPVFAGCFSSGYTHDAQCVIYKGPDVNYQGKEICIESSVKDIVITDVTDKSHPFIVGVGTYPQVEYAHQGWLSEDQRYFFQDDELDELRLGNNTKTIVWDFTDLHDPVVLTEYIASTQVIDHNLYVKGSYLYQSNYYGGLHILDITDPANPSEVAFFDTVPDSDAVDFYDGSWSNYPFFESGVIAVSSQLGGLFLIKSSAVETADEQPDAPAQFTLSAPFPNPFDEQTSFSLSVARAQRTEVVAYDMLGRQVAVLFEGIITPDTQRVIVFEAQNFPNGKYIVRATSGSAAQSRVITLIR